GRAGRDRPDVTEAGGDGAPVGLHEIGAVVVGGVLVVALCVPLLGGGFVERGVWKKPKADDARRPPIIRPDGKVLAAGVDLHTGILLLVLERIRRAIGAALVEPQSKARRVGGRGRFEARLVDQPQILPAVVAAGLELWVRGQRFEEVEGAEADRVHPVPEQIVAARPDDPGIAPADLGGAQRDPAVHVVEVVLVRRGERRRRPAGALGLVLHRSPARTFRAASGPEPRARRRERPGPDGPESTHRALLDAVRVRLSGG